MPVHYSIDRDQSLVRVVVADPLDVEEIAGVVERLLSDPQLDEGMNVLSDHTRLATSATTAMVKGTPDFLDRLGRRLGLFRCAVVVSSDASFGMARMASAFAENGPAQVRGFRSLEAAEAWLAEPPAA